MCVGAYVCVGANVVVKTRLESFSFVTYLRIITLNSWNKKLPQCNTVTTTLTPKELILDQKKRVTITHVKITRYAQDL